MMLSDADDSCFPTSTYKKYQYGTMWMSWKQYKFHKFTLEIHNIKS